MQGKRLLEVPETGIGLEATHHVFPVTSSPKPPIPDTIRRNTILLAASQGIVASATQLTPALAGLIMLKMTGSLILAGFAMSIVGLTRICISYPAGKIADGFGRKVSLLIGFASFPFGAGLIFYSLVAGSLWLFIVGLMVFGVVEGLVSQLRLAAADMYPSRRKAEGVGYVMTASIFGSLASPLIISYATTYAKAVKMDPYSTPWIAVPFLALVSGVLVVLIRPDPRDIAQNLDKYYECEENSSKGQLEDNGGRVLQFFSYYPIIVAMLATSLAWGSMTMMMSFVSVILQHHAFDLTSISISVAIHSLGMFGLTIPIGRLADRWGRRKTLVAASAISGIGAVITPIFGDFWIITFGIFLVGIGWSTAIVTSTALIADVSPPLVRGRIMGGIEISSGTLILAFPILGGLVSTLWGFTALGSMSVLAAVFTLIVVFFLREPSPGVYSHTRHAKPIHYSSSK